ncbi:tRNA-binding protein [Salininema proteolyticum]|uniref:tRNA-binding protein n=1 Tax=Salininema proteolyticum TaxID=1607685 RepID=A0ABV8TZ10_9ACTN
MAVAEPGDGQITPERFFAAELRVGEIVKAEPFPKARKPAYQLTVDFGPHGLKRSSAQITERYSLEDLPGRRVVAVTNFPPRQIANFLSEVLVLGVPVEGTDEVVLLAPDSDVPLGSRVS